MRKTSVSEVSLRVLTSRTSFLSLTAASLLAVMLSAMGCGPEDEFDISPPRVLTITPTGPIISVEPIFEIEFSESVDPETINLESVVLAPTDVVDSGFLTDIGNAPLSDGTKAEIVESTLEHEGARVTLTPTVRLLAGVSYSVVISEDVRDLNSNTIIDATNSNDNIVFTFQTDDGAPQVVSTDLPEGAETVFPNRKRFRVEFNQAVQGLNRENMTLESDGGRSPEVESVMISPDRRSAELVLGDADTCARLTPNATYSLSFGFGITDDEANEMVPAAFEFVVGSDCDGTALQIVDAVRGIGGETTATVRYFTNKASTTEVRFGLSGGFLGCLNQGCPIVGAPGTDAGRDRFFHTVEITGLEIGQVYDFEVRSEDQVGFVASATGDFVTAELPDIAVNEIMANAPAGIDENDGEFVEVINYGDDPLNLDGWALLTDGGDEVGGDTCVLEGAPTLESGGFLVLGGSGFDAEFYEIDEAQVYRREASTVCGALVNSRLQVIELADPEGRIVSTYASDIVPSREGFSVERVDPSADDVSASFCYCRSDGPTPGAENSVVVEGCEE